MKKLKKTGKLYLKIASTAIFLFLCTLTFGQTYNSYNISLYANWHDNVLDNITQPIDQRYSSVWGYFDPITQKEYAILGGINGTYFIDVTDPANPVSLDYVQGKRSNCTWREYKNKGKYLYAVSDDSSPNSLQIIDMSYLPDSVHVVYDSDQIFSRSHTVYVDGDKLYCGSVKTTSTTVYSMAVYSLANPELPQFISALNTDYPSITWVHDMFVKNDTIFASCGYDGFYIFKLKPDNHFEMLGTLTSYPDRGYNHSSSLTNDGKTMVFTDEVPQGLAVKVIDVSDPSDIQVKNVLQSNEGATAHNPHIVNNKAVISYYMDGVWIYDITYANEPILIGYFDTYPQNGGSFPAGYEGCWGVYPYLPSGIILASDMQNGLFILNADSAYNVDIGIKENKTADQFVTVSPNPFTNEFTFKFKEVFNGQVQISVLDFMGKTIYKEQYQAGADSSHKISLTADLPSGMYFVKISGDNFSSNKKLIKINTSY